MAAFNFDIESYKTRFLGGYRQYHFFVLINFPAMVVPATVKGAGFGIGATVQNAVGSAINSMGSMDRMSAEDPLSSSTSELAETLGSAAGAAADKIGDFSRNALKVFGLGAEQDKFPYYIKSTTLPSSSYTDTATDWQGYSYKQAGRREYNDWTVSYYIDEKIQNLSKFQAWHDMIQSPSGVRTTSPQYMQDQQIYLLNYTGSIIKSYEMVGAWPKTVGEVQLDYGGEEIATFDVTFAYQYYKITDPSTKSQFSDDLIKRGFNRILGLGAF